MLPIRTIIPEEVVPNTIIETGDNTGVSGVQFHNWDFSLEKSQQEQYDWKYATLDCFRDEFEADSDDYSGLFLRGYMNEAEAKAGHKEIVAEVLAKGQSAECLQ